MKRIALLASALCTAVAVVAAADPAPPSAESPSSTTPESPSSITPESPSSTTPESPSSTTPERLYTEGQTAYSHADYATAITRWQESYQLSGENLLLFNIAQAMRLSGDCAGALSTYKRFIANNLSDPTSEQHKLAEDFARELEPTCGVKITPILEKPVLPTTQSHPVQVQMFRPWKTAGLVTGGAGVASIAVGLVLGRHGQTLGDEIARTCAAGCDWSEQKSSDEAGRRDVTIGYALDALGVAAIAGGAIMYYLGDREDEVHVVPTERSHGAVLSWGRAW